MYYTGDTVFTIKQLHDAMLTIQCPNREGRGKERRKFVVTRIEKEINLYGADYYAAVT